MGKEASGLPEQPDSWFSEYDLGGNVCMSLRIKEHLYSEQSQYQRIDVFDTYSHGRVMTLDGLLMVTELDEFVYHEMITHLPLFSHPDPRQVLIIGGGDGGTLREVLKHQGVEHCVWVELDEKVVDTARNFLPTMSCAMDDARAELYSADGIAYAKNAASESFDIILIDSTDPVGPAEGLFTTPFYRDCLRILGTDGILCQQTGSPLFMPQLARNTDNALREAGFSLIRTAQAQCSSYPSGWWTFTLGSKMIDPAVQFRQKDAAAKAFETRYYNDSLHTGCFMLPTCVQKLIGN